MLEQSHIQQIKDKGYTVIKGLFKDPKKIEEWKSLIEAIQKEVILETKGIREKDESHTYSSLVFKDNGRPYMLRCTNKLVTRPEGRDLIKYFEDEFRKINDDVRFIKDRIINQKKDYQGLLPHQDNSSSMHAKITNEFYSAYVSLTDTNEQNGCLWVEDITPKRDSSLGYCEQGCATGKTCKCVAMKITPTDMKVFNGHNMVPVPLQTGDCIMFDGWLLHGTAANLSDEIRQTLIFAYGAVRQEDKDENDIFGKYYRGHAKTEDPDYKTIGESI